MWLHKDIDGKPISELEYHMLADYSNSKANKDVTYILSANMDLCDHYVKLEDVGRGL